MKEAEPPKLSDEPRWYLEHMALFFSTGKWGLLGAISGVCVGLGTRGFLWSLYTASAWASRLDAGGFHSYYLLPVALPACAWLILRFAPTAKGHGTEAVITAVHQQNGKVDWRVAPIKLLATVLTLAFGGSVGKEGPAAQIGAAITSLFADILRLSPDDRRRLVVCGIGAGFAAVFGTPVSGAIFGLEVLYLGHIEYPLLFPCLLAGIVAHLVCGVQAPIPALHDDLGAMTQTKLVMSSALFGVVFGLAALALIETMRALQKFLRRFQAHPLRIAAAGGLFLAFFYDRVGGAYAGLGLDHIGAALAGTEHPPALGFLCKILATATTLEAGGSGGIVTSLFFIGSSCGAGLARLWHLPESAFAAFGLVSLVAAAANTPIAACVMAMELLPAPVGVYAALSACMAFIIVGHRSVYPSQKLGILKSAILESKLDVTMDEFSPTTMHLAEGREGLWPFSLLRRPRPRGARPDGGDGK